MPPLGRRPRTGASRYREGREAAAPRPTRARRRSLALSILCTAIAACGPSAGPADGSGSGDAGEASGASSTAATEASSGSSTGTNIEPDCSRSDLPEPFCHELVLIGDWGGEYLMVHDDVRDGVRPVLVGDESGFRLVNPLEPTQVFAATPLPFEVDHSVRANNLTMTKGDFDGDGGVDFVISSVRDHSPLVVLDGETLEVYAYYEPGFEGWYRYFSTLDVDGDGVDELVSSQTDETQAILEIWSVADGTLSLVATDRTGINYYYFPVQGDFDGDGYRDLSLVWDYGGDIFFKDMGFDSVMISTVLGGSLPAEGLDIQLSPQPLRRNSAAGDFDGDGDDELLVAEEIEHVSIMDWTSDGFVETASFGVDEQIQSTGADTLAPGLFFDGESAGVLLGTLLRHADNGSLEGYQLALLPGKPTFDPIEVPHSIGYLADFNADGVTDIRAAMNGLYGYYLSIE